MEPTLHQRAFQVANEAELKGFGRIDQIEAACEYYHQHAPQAALTNEERAVIWSSFAENGRYKWSEGVYKAIELVLSRRTARPQPAESHFPACVNGQDAAKGEGTHREGTMEHPAEPSHAPSGDVIDRMCAAWFEMDNEPLLRRRKDQMTAAYNVARAHMLAHPPAEWMKKRDAEWDAAIRTISEREHASMLGKKIGYDARALLVTVQTQERMTVEVKAVKNTETLYEVHAGDSHVFTSADERDAERYAAGLRAELERELKAEKK
jgi:hypothetical protein